jgi:hypothetical protein
MIQMWQTIRTGPSLAPTQACSGTADYGSCQMYAVLTAVIVNQRKAAAENSAVDSQLQTAR